MKCSPSTNLFAVNQMGVSTVNVTPSVIFGPFIRQLWQLWFSSNRNLALPFLSGVWLVGRVIPVSVAVNLSCSDIQGSLVNGTLFYLHHEARGEFCPELCPGTD